MAQRACRAHDALRHPNAHRARHAMSHAVTPRHQLHGVTNAPETRTPAHHYAARALAAPSMRSAAERSTRLFAEAGRGPCRPLPPNRRPHPPPNNLAPSTKLGPFVKTPRKIRRPPSPFPSVRYDAKMSPHLLIAEQQKSCGRPLRGRLRVTISSVQRRRRRRRRRHWPRSNQSECVAYFICRSCSSRWARQSSACRLPHLACPVRKQCRTTNHQTIPSQSQESCKVVVWSIFRPARMAMTRSSLAENMDLTPSPWDFAVLLVAIAPSCRREGR